MLGDYTRWTRNGLLAIALICFFLSGAAGLIYQVVWTRMLTQIFGNTTYAIATVLAAFMAGLALGSYLFGRIADKGKNDFLLYGILEAGVGVYGLIVPWLFYLGTQIYIPLFGLNQSYPLVFNLLLFFLSFVLLALPTLLMGATLPVLSRFFVRSFSHLGRRVGHLYATNTTGAVLGCAVAGYYLIPTLGMRATVFVAAALNLTVAAVIFLIDHLRDKEPSEIAVGPGALRAEPTPAAGASRLGWLLLVCFGLSGFAALIYENAWTRALTLVIGSSVYSFTTMLVTFLVGLALGGFLFARLMGDRDVRFSTFGAIEVGVGLTALATIPLFERLPLIFLRLLQALGDSFSLFLSVQLLLSALVMLLPTVFLGMTFPLVARLFTQSLYRVGSSVGISYAANTFGAILGAFAGGFILIPTLGVQTAIVFAVIVNLLVGWALIAIDPRLALRPRLTLGAVVLAAAMLMPGNVPQWDRSILTSGVTIYNDRYDDLPLDSLRLEEMRRDKVLYYREGLTATISVQLLGEDYLYFRSNGKIDGSYGDALSQLMTGFIPMLFRPNGARAAVIGLGTGMTAKAVGTFPSVREIEVLEIEPAMVEASKYFNEVSQKLEELPPDVEFPAVLKDRVRYDPETKMLAVRGVVRPEEKDLLSELSRDPAYRNTIEMLVQKARHSRHQNILADPRVRLIATDGRNYILATPKRYDVITAEPSNPWIAGIANLYTREFYEIVKSKLTEDGVFAQWFHNYSMSPDDFRMVFRTFAEAFPHASLWGMKESDFLLVGSKKELDFDYRALKELYAKNDGLKDDFQYLGLSDVYAVLGLYKMGRKELLAFSEGAAINTDDGAELEFSAPKNVRRPTSDLNRRLMEPHLVEAPWLDSNPRSVAPPLHHFYLAEIHQANGDNGRALQEVEKAIGLDGAQPDFYVLKTKILLDEEKSGEAAKAALLALDLSPRAIKPILAASEEFYLPEAKLVYTRTIRMGTRELVPYLGLGNIARHYQDLKEAEKWFGKAREINPDHPAVLLGWGRLLYAKGDFEGARQFLERARMYGEESANLYGVLAETYSKLQLWPEAAEAYRQALRYRRQNHDLRRSMGIALKNMGRLRDAEVKFREVLALSPSDVEAWEELRKMGKKY
jgi:predicted membrane-bound spermidine synthase/tetratricopeptide (TPR) repeat protein